MGVNRTNTEQFQLRLPPGLRDRIKSYAERHDRSLNAEIIRVLEREFPEQWPLSDRITDLYDMMFILKAGKADARLDDFVSRFEETVEGIASGRVTDVDPEVQRRISNLWAAFKDRESEDLYEAEVSAQAELDQEELDSLERNGTTEKFADPPAKPPNAYRDAMYLANVLPAQALSQLATKLGKGDLAAAADLVRNLSKEDLVDRVKFEAMPIMEQYRLRGEAPPSEDDPFPGVD